MLHPTHSSEAPPVLGPEQERLAALHALQILDTDPEQSYDDITLLAARICEAPIALISLVGADRQWFKSRVGLDVCETSRGVSFCAHAIGQRGIFQIPDTREDARFAGNPLVTGAPHIRFYAGVPLVTAEGHALGSLCVIDRQPRTLTPEQQAALSALARMAVTQMALRRQTAEQEHLLTENVQITEALPLNKIHSEAILEATLDCIVILDARGRVMEWNPQAERTFGWTRAEALGQILSSLIIPERLRGLHAQGIALYVATGQDPLLNRRVERPALRRDGAEIPVELTAVPIGSGDDTIFTLFLRDLSAQKAAEGRFRMLAAAVENANDVVLITEAEPFDMPGPRVVYVNDAFTRMTGYAPEEILGKTPRILQGPGTDRETCAFLRSRLQAWEPVQVELLNYRKDGTPFWSQLHIRPVADETGWYTHWISIQRDVTERRHAEEAERADARRREEELERRVAERTDALARQSQRTQLLLDAAGEGFFGIDLAGRNTFVNPAAADMLGYTVQELLGAPMHATLHHTHADGRSYPREDCPIYAALTDGAIHRIADEVFWRKDGTSFPVEYVSTPVHEEGLLIGAVVTFRDVSAQRALQAERERMLAEALERADRDPLTGLLNHRAFHKRLEEEADRAQREGGTLAVAIIDLDDFKFFNDVYGHVAGDDVLRQVADTLRVGCRSYDVLARFGGDQFVLLLPGRADAGATVSGLAERLTQIGYQLPGSGSAIPIGATMGLAVFPEEAATRADVVDLADQRLRRAKTGGGGVEALIADLRARLPTSSAKGFSMLSALVTAVDTKDRYTRRHSEDVLTYSLQIAEGLGLDEDARQTIAVAALLHDVGKIGVPDAILRKPGRLSDAEFEAIQQHPVMGAAIVGAVPGFEEALDAVRHHHERWDGGGYPGGLRGEETPLPARLMAVADAFSAMTTDRPYRKGMTDARALAILAEGAGTQWDPVCVQVFIQARQALPHRSGEGVTGGAHRGAAGGLINRRKSG